MGTPRPPRRTSLTTSVHAELQQRLDRTREEYENLFDSVFEAVIVFEPTNEVVLEVNRRACELYGFCREEFVGMSLQRLTTDVDRGRAAIAEVRRSRRIANFTTAQRRHDGTEMIVECNASVMVFQDREAIVTVNRDISERRRLERQLQHAEQMTSIGELAAGVAHEFNNVLASVLATAESLLDEITEPGLRERLEQMLDRAEGGAQVSRQLLALGRPSNSEPEIVSVGERVAMLVSSIRPLLGDSIELRVSTETEHDTVLATPTELDQVVFNLLLNARDAMPHGGAVRIAIEREYIDSARATDTGVLPPGAYIRLTVQDQGTGIPEVVRSRVFDPFVTTKGPGEGTGLGLAVVSSIVARSGGSVDLQSSPLGSVFAVFLPAVDEQSAPATPDEDANDERTSETLLVVDDEAIVTVAVSQGLRRAGYRVLTAHCCAEAVHQIETFDGTIDAVLTDVSMPDGDGPSVVAELRRKHPDAIVVFMSGYAADSLTGRHPETHFLQKPFTRKELHKRLRIALDERARRLE